jgi:hypothetical protein
VSAGIGQCMAFLKVNISSVWIWAIVESWPARSNLSKDCLLPSAIHKVRSLSKTRRRSGSATILIALSHSAALSQGSTCDMVPVSGVLIRGNSATHVTWSSVSG